MDLFEAAEIVEAKLKKGNYAGKRIGSGTSFDGQPVRDVQFYYGKNKITLSKIKEFCPKGYIITKLRDIEQKSFTFYITKSGNED